MESKMKEVYKDLSVSVAPNEYVTKYSYNRNFLRLLTNDDILQDIGSEAEDVIATTYNKDKMYSANQYVFYKLSSDSLQLYLLKSLQNANNHKPLVKKTTTGELEVVTGEYWEVVGVPRDEEGKIVVGRMSPKGVAKEVLRNSKTQFQSLHELNKNDDAHPSGKLGFQESTKLLKDLTNLKFSDQSIQYPNSLESLNKDNVIQKGYMRKWQNGLLEYDISFQLANPTLIDDGRLQLSANTTNLLNNGSNMLYFKESKDRDIFDQGGENYVITRSTKQVNLNDKINAYSAEIKFPESFVDTNYMIFSSSIKNVETEAYNVRNTTLKYYDPRLYFDGLVLTGYNDQANYATEVIIPSRVTTVAAYALEEMRQTGSNTLNIVFEENSQINTICEFGFSGADIRSIDLRPELRYIGYKAFSGCPKLEVLNFYIKRDVKLQPIIANSAFLNSPIKTINIYYQPDTNTRMLFGSGHEEQVSLIIPLEDKLMDSNLRAIYGLGENVKVEVFGKDTLAMNSTSMISNKFKRNLILPPSSNDLSDDSNKSDTLFASAADTKDPVEYTVIDISSFIKKFSSKKPKMVFATSNIISVDPIDSQYELNKFLVYDKDNFLSGINLSNSNFDYGNLSIDISKSKVRIIGIRQNAFSELSSIESLIIPSTVKIFEANALNKANIKNLTFDLSNDMKIDKNFFDGSSISSLQLNGDGPLKSNTIDLSRSNITNLELSNISKFEKEGIIGEVVSVTLLNNVPEIILETGALSSLSAESVKILQDNLVVFEKSIPKAKNYLALSGKALTLSKFALSEQKTTQVEVNMDNSYIESYCFSDSEIKKLNLKNLDKTAKKEFELRNQITIVDGFDSYAFYSLSCENIQFCNTTSEEVIERFLSFDEQLEHQDKNTGEIINLTDDRLFINKGTVITCEDKKMIFDYNQSEDEIKKLQLKDLPKYLYFDGPCVISCNFTLLKKDNIHNVDIPDGVLSVMSEAFYSKNKNQSSYINSVIFPKTIKHIGDKAFCNSKSLSSIRFEDSPNSIQFGKDVFLGCVNLVDIQM